MAALTSAAIATNLPPAFSVVLPFAVPAADENRATQWTRLELASVRTDSES